MNTTPSWADTGKSVVGVVGKLAGVALQVGDGVEAIDRYLGPFASFIPYYSQAMAVMKIAEPIVERIAAAAPAADRAIEAGRPLIEMAQSQLPRILPDVKALLAIAINHDPERPEENLTAADIGDDEAKAFAGPVLFGRRWTREEENRWFDWQSDLAGQA